MQSHTKILSYFIACGTVLQVAESMIPHPVPGLRLGLANMIPLLLLNVYGYREAFIVALLRPLVSSIILGSFLTPAFLMSFSSSVVSFLVMSLFFSLKRLFSNIGISIFGAISHNLTQLLIAYFILVRHSGIFVFIPLLLFGALLAGFITGYAVNYTIKNRDIVAGIKSYVENVVPIPQSSTFGRATGIVIFKIIVVFVLLIFIVSVYENRFMLYFLPLLILLFVIFKVPIRQNIARLKYLWLLSIISLLIHSFSTPGEVILDLWIFKVTQQGLLNAASTILRIVLLTLTSGLLIWTTDFNQLANAILRILSPFKFIKLPAEKTITLMALAMLMFTNIWQKIATMKLRKLTTLLDILLTPTLLLNKNL